jgi:response regulator of citrate/malate metabolism
MGLDMRPMPTNRVTMRGVRETLRLHRQAGLSYNEVGRALEISKCVVGKYVSPARVVAA